ncbi:MAG: response regulator [Spirochaetes bacterium]|nr:response regulator [Spirochaetota bacterium]
MKKIFLVEDSSTIKEDFVMILSKFGFTIVDSLNCDDCILELRSSYKKGEWPALVIVDVDMPRIDGFRFVDELRRFDKYTPVIFMTRESEGPEESEFIQTGAIGWINKSLDEDSAKRMVRKYIGY